MTFSGGRATGGRATARPRWLPRSAGSFHKPHSRKKRLAYTYYAPNLPQALPKPMDQWISAILHGTPMTITVDDSRNLTHMLEGIYAAARSGSTFTY